MHPVYIIIIAIVAYAVIMGVMALSRGKRSHFVCPKCGNNFQVKGAKYLFSPKTFTSHYVTCPKCGYSGMMDVEPGAK